MANTMVSVRSSELGPLAWDTVTKRQLFLQKVSSKLGPNARQLGKGTRGDKASGPAPPPGSGAGHPGQGSPGHRQAQIEGSMLGEVGHCGSPTRVRQSQSQSQADSGNERPDTAELQVKMPSTFHYTTHMHLHTYTHLRIHTVFCMP
ncbi:putative microtubule-associated tumor suppressor candidate 2 -like [Scophthalmus maximus]|uniref:Putative microtubule-associated tumor suppressor candidate 2-like n=1 Tax=Scophthalmus maximus TaxID=52904 RepID=A0A2U9BQ47_SCOMX|nr:putative microtubule-associated tumor suppressor candidate 2 -like [Scophthalmus maximus]